MQLCFVSVCERGQYLRKVRYQSTEGSLILIPFSFLFQSLSPAGLSPSYPTSEPSPDPMSSSQPHYNRRGSLTTPRIQSASTMMGQLMGALNNSAVLDDLNLNIETFHGGFDCNVDEVIKHELSMDGSLDFNFSHNQVRSFVSFHLDLC